jgi:RNA polymerase sigma factor (sigma-70 family)
MADRQLNSLLRQLRLLVQRPGLGNLQESQLLQRFVEQGDEAAFEVLFWRHAPMVLRLCRKLLRQPHDAEDAFQAVFLILVRKAGTVTRGEALASWLYKVAWRVALEARSRAARSPVRAGQFVESSGHSSCDEPATEASRRELDQALDEEIYRLPERYRLPIVLCHLEGKTQEEVAQELGWAKGTVSTRVIRARALLRQRLTRRGVTLSTTALGAHLAQEAPGATIAIRLADNALRTVAAFGAQPAAAAAPATAAVVLANSVLKGYLAAKLKFALAIVLLTGIVATGTVASALHMLAATTEHGAAAAGGSAPEPETPDPRSDRFGDPLPPGAIARLGTARLRHRGSGLGVLNFSPDGTRLYTCEWDGVFNVWDVRTGKNLRRYPLPIDGINGYFALSPDTKLLACRGPRTIDLRESATTRLVRQIQLPTPGQGARFAFAADGRTLACINNSDEVCFWDSTSGELLRRLVLPQRIRVTRIEFPPDGRSLLLKAADGWIHYFDLATGKELYKFYTGENNAPSYAFLPGTNTLATAGGMDASIKLWDLATGKERGRFPAQEFHSIRALAYSPDGKTLVAADFTTVFFLNGATGEILHKVTGLPVRGAYQLRFSPDGKTLATTGNDTAIRLFDVAMGKELFADAGHHGWISGLAFSPNDQTLATVSGDGSLRLWDAATGQPLHVERNKFERWSDWAFSALTLSRDGRTLVAGDPLGTISFWDFAGGRELRRFVIPPESEQELDYIQDVALSPDGAMLTTLSQHHYQSENRGQQSLLTLRWDVQSGKEIMRLLDPPENMAVWALSSNGGLRASYNRGPVSMVHEITTGRRLAALDGKCQYLWPVAFSPHGRLVAGVCQHGVGRPQTVAIWEWATGQEIWRFALDGKSRDASLAFSADGKTLAAGGDVASGLRLWDLATGNELVRFQGMEASASQLAFSTDGRRLASGLANGTALIWDLETTLRRPAARTRDFSPAEIDRWWSELAAEDARRGQVALWALAAVPQQAVPWFKARLHAATPADPARLGRLISDLDSATFAVRQNAMQELEALGPDSEGILKETLAGKPSAEVRRRLEALLAKPRPVRSPELIRHLRALETLEYIGTADAQQVLRGLTQGWAEALLTQQAKASLERLAGNSK